MTPELQKEFDELNKYKEFTKLFFNIFELDYLKKHFTLIMQPQEPYKIEENKLRICLTEEDANKVLEVAILLEQDEVEE
jgi:hypothetical protein